MAEISGYEKILSYYEDFRTYGGELSGGEGFFDYRAPSSLHSPVTCFAYGISEKRSCVSLEKAPCVSRIRIPLEDLGRRFYIKLTACLFCWEEHVCSIKIAVNGETVHQNPREFFENVNLGWPSLYFPLDGAKLREGVNLVEIRQTGGNTALLVNSVNLLSLPGAEKGAQLTCLSSARIGAEFTLGFYDPDREMAVSTAEGCVVEGILRSPLNGSHALVKIRALREPMKLELRFGNILTKARLPHPVPASGDFCMVGTDSDDHRHDDSDETDRILEIFVNTGMGNYWQARPQQFRNYFMLSEETTWKRRTGFLRDYGVRISLSDSEGAMPFMKQICGESFVGKHFHEAYLYFCAALEQDQKMSEELLIDTKALRDAQSFGESRERFEKALRKMYLGCREKGSLTSVGSPSLLTCYEAGAGFERVTIEPVSNINLLVGAVRGSARAMWGAHVPTDWYFGEPNDEVKSRKFLLAMELLYLSGADYIYAENALFKTNAFSRLDWEDAFCARNRRYLREFYDYTVRCPREGTLKTDLAVIYGNNEYFMWHYDNRIAELPENDDWDINIWGKWHDNRHHRCFRAVDAWLPEAENQHSRKNVLNLNLFSGTPYGSVDVIPYRADYKKYKAVVLLGWNTYEEGFADRIYDFVSKGGKAFVSYCHFNRTDRCDLPMEYASSGEVEILLGFSGGRLTSSVGKIVLEDGTATTGEESVKIVSCRIEDGRALAVDEAGNVMVWSRRIGRGELFFGAFADYECPGSRLEVMKYVMERIGRESVDVECSNRNICFTERVTEDGRRLFDVLNMCPNGQREEYRLLFKDGRVIAGTAGLCEIRREEA